MPGGTKQSDIDILSNRFISIADGLIVLILAFLATQLLLVINSYSLANNFLIDILLIIPTEIMGIVLAKTIIKSRSFPITLAVLNLLGLILLVWLLLPNYSADLLFELGIVLFITYLSAINLAKKIEYLKSDFDSIIDLQAEKQGLNFKRNKNLFKDIKLNLIVVDCLAVVSWLAIKDINLKLILSGIAMLSCQFILWQILVLNIKSLNWLASDADIDFRIFVRSIGWSIIIILIVSSLSLLAPIDYEVGLLNSIGSQLMTLLEDQNIRLKPNVAGIAKKQTNNHSYNPEVKQFEDDNKVTMFMVFFFIALVMLAVIIVIYLILAISFIVNGKSRKIKQIPKLIIEFIDDSIKIIRSWLSLFKGGIKRINNKLNTEDKTVAATVELENNSPLSDFADQIDSEEDLIALFWELLNQLEQNGVSRKESQTLDEYFNIAKKNFPNWKEEFNIIRQLMKRVIYGKHNINSQRKKVFKKVITKLK